MKKELEPKMKERIRKLREKANRLKDPTLCESCGQTPGFDEGCPLCNDPDIWRNE